MTLVHTVSRLSNRDLVSGLERLITKGRELDAELLRFIAEVDRRKLYREHACSSMFAFCTERLGMSEDVAFRRIRVARMARELPTVLEHLAEGRVHLSGLALLAPHLKPENAAGVLARAQGKSKREIERLVRELAPLPDVATSIRKASAQRPRGAPQALATDADQSAAHRAAPAPGRATSCESNALPASSHSSPGARPNESPSAVQAKSPRVRPLSPARYHVSFTASAALKDHIDRARELAGHAATVESLFEEAMALLVATLEQKRLGVRGAAAKTRAARPRAARSRYVPKAVRREVYERDGKRCTFVDTEGRRCSERRALQLDHIHPYALGGDHGADNLRLRCAAHNLLHAEQAFGPLFVAQRIAAPAP